MASMGFARTPRIMLLGGLCVLFLAGCKVQGIPLGTGNVVQGSGTLKTETVPVSGLSGVVLAGIGSLVIEQTGQESLTITAEDNLLPLIDAGVQGTTLNIHNQPTAVLKPTKPIVYLLTVKHLAAITLQGAGTVTTMKLSAPTLTVSLSGAGGATLSGLVTTTLTATISGSGTMQLSGQTQTQTVTSSGVGMYDATNFASHVATVRLSGVGNARVRVSDTLNATITGIGSLTYYGNPAVTQHITGKGSVKKG